MTDKLYDVVAVSIATGKVVSLYGESKTAKNAEAIINMAVMRQGVNENFYAEVPANKFKIGDTYKLGE